MKFSAGVSLRILGFLLVFWGTAWLLIQIPDLTQSTAAAEKKKAVARNRPGNKKSAREKKAMLPALAAQTAVPDAPIDQRPGANKGPFAIENPNSRLIEDFLADAGEGRRHEEYDSPGEAWEYYLRKRLPEGEEALPVEKYFEAYEQVERMPQFSTADNREVPSRSDLKELRQQPRQLGTWTPLGPGNIGGRTRAIIINPNNPSIIYAGGVGGGVWKSIND